MKSKQTLVVLLGLTTAALLGCGDVAPEVDEATTQASRSALTLSEDAAPPPAIIERSPALKSLISDLESSPPSASATESKGCDGPECEKKKQESKSGNPGGTDPLDLQRERASSLQAPAHLGTIISLGAAPMTQASASALSQAP